MGLVSTALTIALVVAAFGAASAYLNGLRLDQRRDRIERTSRQLGELYGPLLALMSVTATSSDLLFAWFGPDVLLRPNGQVGWQPTNLSKEHAAIWRLWVVEVFMPANRRMVEVITTKADLLEESEMPTVLLTVCAHVASFEPLLKRWEANDFRDHVALIGFPPEALVEITSTFGIIKARQARLLGGERGRLARFISRKGDASTTDD